MGRGHAQLREDVVAFKEGADFEAVLFVAGRVHHDVHPGILHDAGLHQVGQQAGTGVLAARTRGPSFGGLRRRQGLAGNALVDVEVAAAGFLGHFRGEGAGVLAVFLVGNQPLAHVLLVHLGSSERVGRVVCSRPEARRVRRVHLVDENQLAVQQAKLVLGIDQDNALFGQ